MATDTLSDVLKSVRLTGAAYFEIAAQEPWSVHSPARELILPKILPGADRLIAYHVVTSGRCFASLDGGEAVPLEAGEVVLFTNADPHVMASAAGMRAEPPSADMIDVAGAGPLAVPHQPDERRRGVGQTRRRLSRLRRKTLQSAT